MLIDLALYLKSAGHGAMVMITQERLKELFSYNPETGIFILLIRTSPNTAAGTEAGWTHKSGRISYRRVVIDGAAYRMHRLAWLYMHGVMPSDTIDHIDGNGLNNAIDNLRDVTNKENHKNRARSINNTSGTTGVCFHKIKQKWQAYIKDQNRIKHLGYFDDLDSAISARKSADVKYGYHLNHGRCL